MDTRPFSELVEINPRVKIDKERKYPFVEMSVVKPNRRYVQANQHRVFKGGGTKFQHGDVLFARITPCLENGKIVQYQNSGKQDAFGSTEFFVFREIPGVSDAGFVYYLAKSDVLRKPAEKSMSGTSGRQRADLESIINIEVPSPPLPTQHKIAAILSAYDDLIENNLRRIKILEEMAQNLYREWFVKFRFPGHQNTRLVDSPLGKIPAGWEVQGAMENKNWSFLRQNISPFSCTKRYFATADIDAITITGEGIPYTYPDKPSRAQKQPTLWSVWFARMQETYKVLGIAQSNAVLSENCMLSSGFAGFESVDKESFAFLFLTIKSENFHREKDRFCTGATQRSLTNDGLSRIQTISPPREIVREFGGGGGGMCKSH